MAAAYRFDRFLLDVADRRLLDNGQPVELSGRYLDALILLIAEEGRLVTKARLLEEVWRGVPVTEEALTQCVRSLRKVLGDDAGRPRFIETAPRYGYRFIARVTPALAGVPDEGSTRAQPWSRVDRDGAASLAGMGRAGLIGGGAAGLIGGLGYGFAGVADGGVGGSLSGLLVLAGLTSVIGMIGGACLGFGIGAASLFSREVGPLFLVGGAMGGMVVGAVARLAGLDAFALLLGSAPQTMTGAGEGLLLGAAIGAAMWYAQGRRLRVAILASALLTGSAGAGSTLLGGRLMGGSLAALAAQYPGARLQLDHLGIWFGEPTFGMVSQAATAGLEGALFGAGMVWALSREHRRQRISACV